MQHCAKQLLNEMEQQIETKKWGVHKLLVKTCSIMIHSNSTVCIKEHYQ